MSWETLSPLAAVLTAFIGWYLAESVRNKNSSETTKNITDAALGLVAAQDKEIAELREERTCMRLYVIYLLTGINKLTGQLKDPPDFIPMSIEEYQNKENPPAK